MVEEQKFEIVITKTAERAYFEVLDYVFQYHDINRANEIAEELILFPSILETQPYIGSKEMQLINRHFDYRFLLYHRTKRATVKIIYFVDENLNKIFITDFFPTEIYDGKIKDRS